jgi:hypothetical protein
MANPFNGGHWIPDLYLQSVDLEHPSFLRRFEFEDEIARNPARTATPAP